MFRRCLLKWPFTLNALVPLPEHLHAIWSLPPGDAEYPKRWGWIKKEFIEEWLAVGGCEEQISDARRREKRRGIWQPRYWEHTLQDEDDFERHFDYVHFNPVKHGLVQCPRDWFLSSFHRWVRAGVCPNHWACSQRGFTMDFTDIEKRVGEPESLRKQGQRWLGSGESLTYATFVVFCSFGEFVRFESCSRRAVLTGRRECWRKSNSCEIVAGGIDSG